MIDIIVRVVCVVLATLLFQSRIDYELHRGLNGITWESATEDSPVSMDISETGIEKEISSSVFTLANIVDEIHNVTNRPTVSQTCNAEPFLSPDLVVYETPKPSPSFWVYVFMEIVWTLLCWLSVRDVIASSFLNIEDTDPGPDSESHHPPNNFGSRKSASDTITFFKTNICNQSHSHSNQDIASDIASANIRTSNAKSVSSAFRTCMAACKKNDTIIDKHDGYHKCMRMSEWISERCHMDTCLHPRDSKILCGRGNKYRRVPHTRRMSVITACVRNFKRNSGLEMRQSMKSVDTFTKDTCKFVTNFITAMPLVPALSKHPLEKASTTHEKIIIMSGSKQVDHNVTTTSMELPQASAIVWQGPLPPKNSHASNTILLEPVVPPSVADTRWHRPSTSDTIKTQPVRHTLAVERSVHPRMPDTILGASVGLSIEKTQMKDMKTTVSSVTTTTHVHISVFDVIDQEPSDPGMAVAYLTSQLTNLPHITPELVKITLKLRLETFQAFLN